MSWYKNPTVWMVLIGVLVLIGILVGGMIKFPSSKKIDNFKHSIAGSASLVEPQQIAQYIADTENNRIRKVNRDDIITTVAGDGKIIIADDGELATL